MRNNRLWKRVAATALAIVLAVPAAGIGAVKQAEAKTVYKAVIAEDFAGGSYSEKIMSHNNGQLVVKDGVMWVSGPAGSGIRAAFVDVEPEQTYRISYKVKVDKSSVNAFVQPWKVENGEEVEGSYGDADYLGSACYQWGDGSWHDFCVEYTVPADKNQLQFVLYENDGVADYTFAIDDFKIEAVKEIPSLVANGNFGEDSADTTGWNVETASKKQVVTKKEYMVNGDFEGEAVNYGEANSANASIVSGAGVDGSRALKFTRADESAVSHPYVFFSPEGLDTTGTVEYTLSFKLRSTGAHWQGYIIENGATSNWGAIGWTAANDTWTEYTYTFVTTTGTAQIGIQAVQGAGDIYIDDFSVAVIKENPVYIYTDGVGEFGRDGYGLKITDDTATATVGATENIYEYSVWVKLEEGAKVTLLANGAQKVASSDNADGEWINLTGEFVAEDGLETFGVEAEGTVYVDDVEVYAHVHDIVPVEEKEASCTEPGVEAHYVCSSCGTHFGDEAGTIVLEEEDYVIPASGHDYDKVTTKATYKKAGSIVEKCACGAVKSKTVIYAPTSITATGKTYNKKAQTTTIVVKDSKGKVIPSTEYTVTGNKATKVGTYTATVTFKGAKYYGKMTVKWKINPLGTSIKSVKGAKKSLKVTWKAQKSETQGYKIQVSTDKNFKKSVKTVKVSKNKTTSTTVKGLKANKKYYVRICTYKGSYVSSWSKAKTAKAK